MPDLVVLDILLPQMSGFSILQKMKEDDAIRNIPVVILSNLFDEEDRKRGNRLGAVCYLLKVDMTPDEVVKKVQSFLTK